MKAELIVLSCLCWTFLGKAIQAGDTIERLRQLQVESASQEFPSILYFEINLIEESNGGKNLSERRFMGRQINGGKGRIRLDFEFTRLYLNSASTEREHFLKLSDTERFYFMQLPGSPPQEVKYKPGMQLTTISFVSPWNYSLSGSCEIGVPNMDPIREAIENFEDVGDRGFFLRSKKGKVPGAVLRVVDFDKELDWMVRRSRTYVLGEDVATRHRKDIQINSPERDIREFTLMLDVETEWKEVPGIGHLPFRVHSNRQFFRAKDPTAKQEMEAFFYGYQFDNLDIERYFDKARFNPTKFPDDFSLKAVELEARKVKAASR
jgi:hypothetical protein